MRVELLEEAGLAGGIAMYGADDLFGLAAGGVLDQIGELCRM